MQAQPRIDVVVTGVDGQPARRVEHRGTAWIGGRPQVRGRLVVSMGGGLAPVGEPFWLPDSLAYRTSDVPQIVLAAGAALQSARGDADILDVTAALAPHPQHPELSYVAVTVTAAGRMPLGVAYQVCVLSPVGAVVEGDG